ALEAAGLEPGELDMLICATMTPDVICPATAAEVVKKIGAIPCGAMDINIACTGLVAAINTGSAMVETGMYKHVAVIGADTLSSITDYE
ncbi:3-oxoacyl-ACP synthase, partial [Planococcus sp. SIMBA_160]